MRIIREQVRRWRRRRSRPTPQEEAAAKIRRWIGPRMASGPAALTTDLYAEALEGEHQGS